VASLLSNWLSPQNCDGRKSPDRHSQTFPGSYDSYGRVRFSSLVWGGKHLSNLTLLSGQYRSSLLPLFLVFAFFAPKCDHHQPTVPIPNIGVEGTQALNAITRQVDETTDFVARLKGKADITPQQLEYASDVYGRIGVRMNPLIAVIKDTGSGSNLTENEFRDEARAAIETNIQFNVLAENAIYHTHDTNFVLTNANTLQDAWTTVWKAVPGLTPQQRQQLFTFLDSRIAFKSWNFIKKK
jgi:hypothetical protein